MEFVVQDEHLDRAYQVLLERGFLACSKGKECDEHPEATPKRIRVSPPAPRHLHLYHTDPRPLLLHRKSETLSEVPNFEALSSREHPDARIILASDTHVLAPYNTMTHTGAYPASLPPVRAPSWHCLLEAFVILIERERDEDDDSETWSRDWLVMASHLMPDEGKPTPLNLAYLDPRCREFVHNLWTRSPPRLRKGIQDLRETMHGRREVMDIS